MSAQDVHITSDFSSVKVLRAIVRDDVRIRSVSFADGRSFYNPDVRVVGRHRFNDNNGVYYQKEVEITLA